MWLLHIIIMPIKRWKNIKSSFEKAIEYYEAYNNLGAVLGKNEQYDEAIEAYNKVSY